MTELHEISSFLLPGSDPLPWVFLVAMASLTAWTIGGVVINAKRQKWEGRWNGGGGLKGRALDRLDAEFGSVTDISYAVATRSEKLADIMPGILLVLGLLGTFIGLGIALNKASMILAHAGANGAGAPVGDMSELTGMMQGLGIKFKTSTWGIMGFLLLKMVFWWNDFEERRLRWAIGKMKEEMDLSRDQKSERHKDDHHTLLKSIVEVGEKFASVMKEESALDRSATKSMNERMYLVLVENYKQTKEYVESSKKSLEQMSASAGKIGTSADKLGVTLKETFDTFGNSVEETLDGVRADLRSTISDFSVGTNNSLDGIKTATVDMKACLDRTTRGISSALTSLSNDVQSILSETKESMQETAKRQESAQREIFNISETLQKSVENMTATADSYGQAVQRGLTGVSESYRQMKFAFDGAGKAQATLEELVVVVERTLASALACPQSNTQSIHEGKDASDSARSNAASQGIDLIGVEA